MWHTLSRTLAALRGSKNNRKPLLVRPLLEALEDRFLPAPVISTWTGGAGMNNPNWSAAANWTNNAVPKVDGDQATFDGTSVSNCTVDIGVVLANLIITNAYTGTIDNQSPNLVKLTGANSSMTNGTWKTEGIEIAGTFN